MSRPAQHFSAGPLTFRFEPDTGSVRSIRFHGHEILRGIYPAARDRDWATLIPEAAPVEASVSPDCVRLRLSARVVADEMDLAWTAEIEAHASGRLHYRWRGRVGHESTTNRTGLCVLHPAEAAGAPCIVEHTDGTSEAGWFPQAISPHQPFCDIRAITHVAGRADVEVRMIGEVFEMEDQRNWTDASFKTYCRPLDWPRPYRLAAGAEIEHTVSVEVRGEWRPASAADATESLADAPVPLRLPGIGYTLPGQIPARLRARVRALRPAHVRVETAMNELAATLKWARADAEYLDCALAVAIRGAELPPPRAEFPERCVVHLFDLEGNAAPSEVLAAWRQAGHATVATGSLHHFTELNRGRPAASSAHALTVFGINAQCHAGDDASILETLSQHGVVARLAHEIGGRRPVAVAPISLGRSADFADARMHTEFAALWLLGSLVQLAGAAGVEHATYFHAHGPAGFLREGGETPVERLLLTLAGATGVSRRPTAQAGAVAVHVTYAAGRVWLLANFNETPLELTVPVPVTVPPRSLIQLPA